ncbi:MAG: segregation/condensation protein A [Alphaproteobacteria bacterium]|nr:segregation/condensation protein A [Alphaproteobacteria bacterium]
MSEIADEFEAMGEAAANASAEEALVVAVDGFEGPLDLLLGLARNQKVDLAKISVLRLAEQYLEFVERARRLNLELAADYLVMAAWLAYLKSRLLLPAPPGSQDGEVSADEMAARLRWRLQRLDTMREAAARLMARDRLGREVFARGAPEPLNVVKLRTYSDSLYDLLTAYSTQRISKAKSVTYQPRHAPVLLIEEARARLERMLGRIGNWSTLTSLLPAGWESGLRLRSAKASTLLACLELCRDGRIELRQLTPFEEIYVKDRAALHVGQENTA